MKLTCWEKICLWLIIMSQEAQILSVDDTVVRSNIYIDNFGHVTPIFPRLKLNQHVTDYVKSSIAANFIR